MEEEISLRRSSRSRSRTPSIVSQIDGERVQGMRETAVRIERFQAIREVVLEGSSEVIVNSTSSRSIFSTNGDVSFNNNMSIEAHQNAINLSQEGLKKKKSTKTAATQRSVRAPKKSAAANGGSPVRKKVSKKTQVVAMSSDNEEEVVRTPASKRSGGGAITMESYRTTKSSPRASPQARKLHQDALSGNYDTESSVFLKFYRNVGEWWNVYKKTDYTYSPLSEQRYEVAPGYLNMPNLSRRPVGSYTPVVTRLQQNFTYNLSREDSDSEDFVDPRRWTAETRYYEEQRQFSLVRRAGAAILSVLLLIYAYTFGALFTGVKLLTTKITSIFTRTNESNTTSTSTSYYSYKETLISEGDSTEAAVGLADRFLFFWAWVWAGVTRYWGKLLALLLLLLLAFSIYTGWCCPFLSGGGAYLGDSVQQLTAAFKETAAAFTHWTTDVISSTWTGVSTLGSGLVDLLVGIVAAPFQIAISMFGWVASSISLVLAKINEPLFQSAEMAARRVDDTPIAESQDLNVPHQSMSSIDIDQLALKVLATTAFKNLQSKQATFSEEIKTHAADFQKMFGDIDNINAELASVKSGDEKEKQEENERILASLKGKIQGLEDELGLFLAHSGNPDCCDKLNAQIGALNAKMDSLAVETKDKVSGADILVNVNKQVDLSEQLKERVRILEEELKLAQERTLTSIDDKIEAVTRELAELRNLKASAGTGPSSFDVSDQGLAALIRQQIAIYDADKTNMPDYALENSGGTVLTTRCTESYDERNAFTYYFGMDWLYKKTHRPNNPRSVIQPSVNPGDCFAFKGANAIILIELSKRIHLTAVTMEHIPKSIAISGKIDSAPKEFSVWGFKEVQDPEPLLLGTFAYLDNDQPVQTFDITVEHDSFQKVELRIESNHGHMEYTCIYRFRVHGVPV